MGWMRGGVAVGFERLEGLHAIGRLTMKGRGTSGKECAD